MAYCHDRCGHDRDSARCDGAAAGAADLQNEQLVAKVSAHTHNSALNQYSSRASCRDLRIGVDVSIDAVAMA